MEQIELLVNRLFEKTVYSKNVTAAKKKVRQALCKAYETFLEEDGNEIHAMGRLMTEYGTLEKAGTLAGLTKEEMDELYEVEEVVQKQQYKTFFKRLCLKIYVLSMATTSIFTGCMHVLVYQSVGSYLFTACSVLLWMLVFYSISRRRFISYERNCYAYEARKCIERDYDRYTKKLLNTMYFVVASIFLEIYLFVTAITSAGMTPWEAFLSFFSSAIPFGLITCIGIKNILCKYAVDKQFDEEQVASSKAYFWKMCLASITYWAAILIIVFLLQNIVNTPFHLMIVALLTYFILVISANLMIRKAIVFCNIAWNLKRAFALVFGSFLILAYQVMQMNAFILQPYIATIQPIVKEADPITYDEGSGIYTITTKKEHFKILQLTDIHLGGSAASTIKDYKALHTCEQLIQQTKPDFVVVTGDLSFPLGVMSFSFNNTVPIIEFSNFMRNIGVPWAFTYGNHDTERVAKGSVDEVENTFRSLSFKTSGNLLYPYVQPDITGRNNQVIKICNEDGTIRQALILLDSNDYIGGMNEYDYIHDDQVKWYEEQIQALCKAEGKTVSSLAFFHMPLQQYRTAYELYMAGSDKVKYYFGGNYEKMIDKVCCSDYPSQLFAKAKELKSTKAMFCGHDHYNNLSVEYEGIRLTYGMSIDYLAMPGIDKDKEQRGATLITLEEDSTFEVEQIPYRK